MPDPSTVAFLPVYQNPYQHLLKDALELEGVEVKLLTGLPSSKWLQENREIIDLLHYHWLSGLYLQRAATPFVFLIFLHRFWLARSLGYKIVWTAHNLLPHKYPYLPIHTLTRRLFMHQADAVIVHCKFGRDELLRLYHREKPIYIVPIGSYQGVYPAEISRIDARVKLNLPTSAFVYLFLGNISIYKGLENLVSIFKNVATADDFLVIAGRDRDARLVRFLKSESDHQLRIRAEYIPNEQMQIYLRCADVMVAPFEKILTTSSIIVGMDYSLPIIAPAMGCLPELVSVDAGLLYDPNNPYALGEALRKVKTLDTIKMGQAARKITKALQWDDIAQQTAAIYHACINS